MAMLRAVALPAAAAISVALGLATAPAAQAAASVKVGVAAPSSLYLLPQGADEPAAATQYRSFSVAVYSLSDDTLPTGVTVTGDASALAGKVDLQLPSACAWTSSAHTVFSCATDLSALADDLDFKVRSAAGATEGATGALTFAVHGKGVTAGTGRDDMSNYRTVLTVGHGADLAVEPALDPATVLGGGDPLVIASKAGVQAPVQITNKGDRDASDVYVIVAADSLNDDGSLGLSGSWSNCLYDPQQPGAALCHFPEAVIHPGETYQLSPAVTLTGDPLLAAGFFEYGADVAGGELVGQADLTGAKPGTGAPLQLVPVAATAAPRAAAVPDVDYSNNISLRAVTGAGYNLAAKGGSVRLTVGHAQKISVGLRNTGKSPAKDGDFAIVGLPSGVTTTWVPDSCVGGIDAADLETVLAHLSGVDEKLKGSQFVLCSLESTVAAGHSATFTLTVKATRPLTAAEGSVFVRGMRAEADLSDNLAALDFTATRAASTSASASPDRGNGNGDTASASASAAPATSATSASASPAGTGSGGLASTGGGSQTAPLLLTGLGALLVGGGLMALARRRRAH